MIAAQLADRLRFHSASLCLLTVCLGENSSARRTVSGQWLGGNGVKCVHILALILALLSAVRVCVCVFSLSHQPKCCSLITVIVSVPPSSLSFRLPVSQWWVSGSTRLAAPFLVFSPSTTTGLYCFLSLLVTPARLAVDRPLIVTWAVSPLRPAEALLSLPSFRFSLTTKIVSQFTKWKCISDIKTSSDLLLLSFHFLGENLRLLSSAAPSETAVSKAFRLA